MHVLQECATSGMLRFLELSFFPAVCLGIWTALGSGFRMGPVVCYWVYGTCRVEYSTSGHDKHGVVVHAVPVV